VNLRFFEHLSEQEAADYLRRFLATESATAAALVAAAAADGVTADYGADNLVPVLRWVVRRDERRDGRRDAGVLGDVDAGLPPELIEDERERAALLGLPAGAESLVLRAAYYLGETFVRHRPRRLRWASGDRDLVTENQPVVTGFTRDVELPVILVVSNLFGRVGDEESVPRLVSAWAERVPRQTGWLMPRLRRSL
jgi:hypothetical protein